MKRSPIHRAAQRITKTLSEMEIPFAIAGALAANAHGHVRTTDHVDILLQPEGLKEFKEKWLGRGWVEKFEGSKGLSALLRMMRARRAQVLGELCNSMVMQPYDCAEHSLTELRNSPSAGVR